MPLLALILAALVMALPAAEAQQRLNCAPRNIVTTALAEKHGERPVLRGVAGSAMLEVWLAESGSFSIILTQPSGDIACLIAAGNSMGPVSPPAPGKKS